MKIEFMTTQEASELIQNFISRRKDDLVCVTGFLPMKSDG